MVEIYKKYNTDLSKVLGQYGQAANATTKMIFVNRFKKIGLASGKMSAGSVPKFCCKTVVEINLPELEEMLEALNKCSKQPGSVNYFELGESTAYSGDILKLVLKGSEYGWLCLCKLKKASVPDCFPVDDDNPDPSPFSETPTDELKVEWSECFEKFYISKNEDWSEFGKKLRDFWHDINSIWNDDGTEPSTAEHPTPRKNQPSTSPLLSRQQLSTSMSPAKSTRKQTSSPVKRKQSGEKKTSNKKKKVAIVESDSELVKRDLNTHAQPTTDLLRKGTRVRIARIKNITFEKSSLRRWVKEVFVIHKVYITDPVTYKLRDSKGEDIRDAENQQKTLRVLNVTYPLTIENVSKESCGIRLQYNWYKFRAKSNCAGAGIASPEEEVTFDTQWLYLPPGYYTLDKMLEVLNAYVNEYGVYFLELPSKRVGVTMNVAGIDFVYRYNNTDPVVRKGFEFISRANAIQLEFTKNLKYMLGLDEWILHPSGLSNVPDNKNPISAYECVR
ncbi:Hypothetical predicted protein [Paramuricea clavata]|uniref:Uncharacterized protein n=1 Tax=Paramuricea clavata TaxID=317549 RepID=A0A6S7H0D4_PARCT|nr:Hypothetical predicted protein [Paramuricea clavata]